MRTLLHRNEFTQFSSIMRAFLRTTKSLLFLFSRRSSRARLQDESKVINKTTILRQRRVSSGTWQEVYSWWCKYRKLRSKSQESCKTSLWLVRSTKGKILSIVWTIWRNSKWRRKIEWNGLSISSKKSMDTFFTWLLEIESQYQLTNAMRIILVIWRIQDIVRAEIHEREESVDSKEDENEDEWNFDFGDWDV